MRAIILAAGRGGRLRGVTGNQPKCLVRLGLTTLLERQIAAIRACGVWPITIVAGYQAERVRRIAGSGVEFICNKRFESTNSLYSLWLARDALAGGFIVLNCDVLFHPQVLVDLITARHPDALLVCARKDGERYSDEEMKVRVRAGRVTAIAKTIPSDVADAENVGIAKFSEEGAAVLVNELNDALDADGHHHWLPAAFASFARKRPLYAVDTRGFPWIEIDTPDDYWRASAEVLPAIVALDRRSLSATGHADGLWLGRPSHHV